MLGETVATLRKFSEYGSYNNVRTEAYKGYGSVINRISKDEEKLQNRNNTWVLQAEKEFAERSEKQKQKAHHSQTWIIGL